MRALTKFGGPIADINVYEVLLDNKKYFQANSFLLSDFRNGIKPLLLYSTCDGSGTSVNKNTAIAKSISESMERWSFYQLKTKNQNFSLYGLDVDPTTNGFAAYPGLFTSASRYQSLIEALEKWAIIEWGAENLSLSMIDFREHFTVFEVNTYHPKLKVVLISGKISNFYSYGFACDAEYDLAIEKAKIEYYRNINVLQRYYSSPSSINQDLGKFEKRLVWFSSQDGHDEFERIVSKTLNKKIMCREPKTITDTQIIGPWSKYSTVWRILYQCSNYDYLTEKVDVFFF